MQAGCLANSGGQIGQEEARTKASKLKGGEVGVHSVDEGSHGELAKYLGIVCGDLVEDVEVEVIWGG